MTLDLLCGIKQLFVLIVTVFESDYIPMEIDDFLIKVTGPSIHTQPPLYIECWNNWTLIRFGQVFIYTGEYNPSKVYIWS